MTSVRKTLSNRRNAARSTGPTTVQGRARSSQNARRHGLSTIGFHPEAQSAEVKSLSAAVLPVTMSSHVQKLAFAVAEAQIDVIRVRCAKRALLEKIINGERRESHAEFSGSPPSLTFALFDDIISQLIQLERYERRALSRRKIAVRHFNRARYERGNEDEPQMILAERTQNRVEDQ